MSTVQCLCDGDIVKRACSLHGHRTLRSDEVIPMHLLHHYTRSTMDEMDRLCELTLLTGSWEAARIAMNRESAIDVVATPPPRMLT